MARACGSYPQCHRFKSSRRYHIGEMRKHLSDTPSKRAYGPLVKWLRHGPFTAVTWVRFPYGSPCRHPKGRRQFGGLAQLVRAPASHAGGHWFESSSLHQKVPDFVRNQELFLFMISKVTRHFGVFRLTQTVTQKPRGQESTGEGRMASSVPLGLFLWATWSG